MMRAVRTRSPSRNETQHVEEEEAAAAIAAALLDVQGEAWYVIDSHHCTHGDGSGGACTPWEVEHEGGAMPSDE